MQVAIKRFQMICVVGLGAHRIVPFGITIADALGEAGPQIKRSVVNPGDFLHLSQDVLQLWLVHHIGRSRGADPFAATFIRLRVSV